MYRQTLLALSRWLLCAVLVHFLSIAPLHAANLRETPIVKAIQRARPAVVDIRSERTVMLETAPSLEELEQGRRINGMGTGIVIDPRGYIVTNQHVVDGVQSLKIILNDESIYPGKVVAFDNATDLAIVKIEPKQPLAVIPLGSSADLMVGETVIAVGNAFGYEHTVTLGIVSALKRKVQVNDQLTYRDLIQTDASINPGNSGGPLLNTDGQLVGINVAIRAGAQGIGFALPIDDARKVIADLISIRRLNGVTHGIVGRDTQPGEEPQGVVVSRLELQAAEAAGALQPGDVILQAAGQTITNRIDLERAMLDCQAAQQVEMTVLRGGERKNVSIKLEKLPSEDDANRLAWEVLGLRVRPAAGSVQLTGSNYRGGLYVSDVRSDGPAVRDGIRTGDVLVGLHVWETVNLENLLYILTRPDLEKLSPLKFYVLRSGKTRFGDLKLAATPATTTNR